jgi:hypothetical protein
MNDVERQEKIAAAQAMFRDIFEDGEAEINGRKYRFTSMTHKKRRKVFAFYTKIAGRAESNDFSFLDSPEFEAVEAVINDTVLFNDSRLTVIGDSHWDKYPGDYMAFIVTALGVISYPFLSGSATG